jgi:hypothetical protein
VHNARFMATGVALVHSVQVMQKLDQAAATGH